MLYFIHKKIKILIENSNQTALRVTTYQFIK
jgi:hypothetical protein